MAQSKVSKIKEDIKKLRKIKKMVKSTYFKHEFTQNSDMRGYQQCLRDILGILNAKT